MPLPVINSVNPTSLPAQDAMTFPNSFLTMLHFSALSTADKAKWTCQISTRNFNAGLNVLAPNTPPNNQSSNLQDVAAYAVKYPVFGQILGSVLVVAGYVMAEQNAQANLVIANNMSSINTARNAAIAAANTSLSAAQASLVTANALPDNDPAKAAAITAAQTAITNAQTALTTAQALPAVNPAKTAAIAAAQTALTAAQTPLGFTP